MNAVELFRGDAARAAGALRVMFLTPDASGKLTMLPLIESGFVSLLRGLFAAEGTSEAALADYVNQAIRLYGPEKLEELLGSVFFEALTLARAADDRQSSAAVFAVRQLRLIRRALDRLATLLRSDDFAERDWIVPAATDFFVPLPELDDAALLEMIYRGDPFRAGRVFRYRDGRFLPTALGPVRPPELFFGFVGVRNIFREQFEEFARGAGNVPLLISSLPGHGKTQLVLSHVLSHPDLTLILPEPDVLSGDLEKLLAALALRPDRKFVIFFDDIVPDELDWYLFRTNVGGSFSLPSHIMAVLASNYHFPPSILSRGRSVLFPVFDELRCCEMIEDFLASRGMKHPRPNLISIIGADYTEEFGQKKYTELSPRTLMRYLERYEHDSRKRRHMLSLSEGELITRPDAELFYEFNIRLMRQLYGDEHIERLLKERLRDLEGK